MESSQRVLKVAEAAERLRVTPDTVRRWLRHGWIKGTLMGGDRGGYRIPEQEIERVLAEGPVPAGSDQNNEA